jgi:hypothetical protein
MTRAANCKCDGKQRNAISQQADEAPNAYEFELSGLQGAVENFLGALPLNRNIPAQIATQNIVANCGMFFVALADHFY